MLASWSAPQFLIHLEWESPQTSAVIQKFANLMSLPSQPSPQAALNCFGVA
jgi:hypothetical protein